MKKAKYARGFTLEVEMRVILSAAAISRMEGHFDWLALVNPEDGCAVQKRASRPDGPDGVVRAV